MQDSQSPGLHTTLSSKVRHFMAVCLEWLQDWRWGVRTSEEIHLREVGILDSDCHCYAATNYRRFKQVMAAIDVRPGIDGFMDYGSGLGRVVILAARYPFTTVIGLEVAQELHRRAEANVARARSRFVCKNVRLENADARRFVLPPEITILYFWNPFSETILREVLLQLRQSLASHPRQVRICYASPYTPNCLDNVIGEFTWLQAQNRFDLGDHMHVTIAATTPTVTTSGQIEQ